MPHHLEVGFCIAVHDITDHLDHGLGDLCLKGPSYCVVRQCMHIFFCCISNHAKLCTCPFLQSVREYRSGQMGFVLFRTAFVSIMVKHHLDHIRDEEI